MRLLIPESFIQKGKEYAEQSANYTHNHAGWEQDDRKVDRIARGKTVELFVIGLLQANGVNVSPDQSGATENDDYDFAFAGHKYDIKSSSSKGQTMKVTRTYERKGVQWFVGCIVEPGLQWIEIKGVFSKKQALTPKSFFKYNEAVPGEGFACSYKEGAYYFNGPYIDFEEHFGISRLRAPEMPADYWHRLWCFATNKKLP
jgi:hypothetical protein